jgi:hypothetical protein
MERIIVTRELNQDMQGSEAYRQEILTCLNDHRAAPTDYKPICSTYETSKREVVITTENQRTTLDYIKTNDKNTLD